MARPPLARLAPLALLGLALPARAGVLINEVLYQVAGTDDGLEWVELCNNGGSTVDLTGYTLHWAGTSFSSNTYTFSSGSIPAGGYLLVGYGSSTHPYTFSPALQNGGSAADGVQLWDASARVVDTVLYGGPYDGVLLDDEDNNSTGPAPNVDDDESIGRWSGGRDCVDTNDSSVDFQVYTAPTPGAVNGEADTDTDTDSDTDTDTDADTDADCSVTAGVVLNEFTVQTDHEFVEIYNGSGQQVDLGGWEIEFGTQDWSHSVALPAGSVVLDGGFFVISSDPKLGADVTEDLSDMGNATGDNTDGVRISCNGVGVDTVIYGQSDATNSDEWVDDSGGVCTSFAEAPGSGESATRAVDGADSDLSGVDFILCPTPSPGGANTCVPPVCEPDTLGVVKLNEVLYAPDGDDAGSEWVEIHNGGAADLRLDEWRIESDSGSTIDVSTIPNGTVIPAGGFLVVGGSLVAEADVVDDAFSIPNGTGGDGLRLYDCEGTLLDTLLYGDTMEDGLVGDDGTDAVVAGVDDDESLGRFPDGADTNTPADWIAYDADEVTPGASNRDPNADSGDTGSETDKGGGGCGGGATNPGAENPGGACAVVPTPALPGLLAGLALLIRRRRRV